MNLTGKFLLPLVLLLLFSSCDDEYLSREPSSVIQEEQVWNDTDMIDGLLANYYDRLPRENSLTDGWMNRTQYTDAMWSGQNNENWRNNLPNYAYGWWSLWDYGLIRDLNLAIENIQEYSEDLDQATKASYRAELRFLRAYVYFQHVKRMGGMPLVTETKEYGGGGNVEELQIPRSTEAETYDFIIAELDTVANIMSNNNFNAGSQTRANQWTALALKSRAALYAGSIAKNNSEMASPITTQGNEVGIPGGRAQGYYETALTAAERVIENGPYSLYEANPDNSMNFYEVTMNKEGNNEMIWAEDFSSAADRRHWFAYDNIARPAREDNLSSSSIAPTLNLVEAFDYLNGDEGELDIRNQNGELIPYDSPNAIFENKDPRLAGTVVLPNSTFRGIEINMQAGIMEWDSNNQEYVVGSEGGSISTPVSDEYPDSLNANGWMLTANGGPHRTQQNVSNTGFYLRKFVSNANGASTRGDLSVNWWPRIRLAEMYLNAAEAAYNYNDEPSSTALQYINRLRERAGFGPNSLSSIDMDKIREERRVELAYENHQLWDYKRWRIAHEVWTGNAGDYSANPMALYPYRIYRPGHEDHGKYVFLEMRAPKIEAPRNFRMGNYYSEIPQEILNNNPELVRNPFH